MSGVIEEFLVVRPGQLRQLTGDSLHRGLIDIRISGRMQYESCSGEVFGDGRFQTGVFKLGMLLMSSEIVYGKRRKA